MYYASGLLGLPGELRVAPLKNTVAVGIDESHHYQYFLEEPIAAQNPTFDAASELSSAPSGQSVWTVSGTTTAVAGAVSFYNVNQSSPLRGGATASGTTPPATKTNSSVATEVVVGGVAVEADRSATMAAGTGQTEVFHMLRGGG